MRITVWDLPVRICHWLLALSVLGAFIAVSIGEIDWHVRFGHAAATLALFRVLWGFVGSETARFARFVPGPGTLIAYLRGRWRGVGHNPLGALSVLALLAAVLMQAGTGIFANDDIIFDGPWSSAVGKEMSDELTGWHKQNRWVLLGLIALHLVAVAAHVGIRRQPLVRAMITGKAKAVAIEQPRMRSALLALPVFALAVFLTGLAFRYWIT